MIQNGIFVSIITVFLLMANLTLSKAEDPWLTIEGKDGPGKGKHIVLISGDEEYRSEEALPQLGKILAEHHGFKCTVLFAINPDGGYIDPNHGANIPGLEALKDADLMITLLRFRKLPTDQMKFIDDYLKSGRPVIGMRTSTHAFNGVKGEYSHYNNGYNGPKIEWKGGFGKFILGEKWVAHHGGHKSQSTRGLIAEGAKDHPIVRGLSDGDIWGPSDVYTVRLPLPSDSKHIVMGQVMNRDKNDPNDKVFFGMKPTDNKHDPGKKNNPMMPVGWVKSYQLPDGGKAGMVFNSTMGASTDLVAAGTRKMFVNAAYWLVGLEDKIPENGCKVKIVGKYVPTAFSFGGGWKEKNRKPADLK